MQEQEQRDEAISSTLSVSTPQRIAHMLGLQTPQTGEDAKEEEILCCGVLLVNDFLLLYMALAYGTCDRFERVRCRHLGGASVSCAGFSGEPSPS